MKRTAGAVIMLGMLLLAATPGWGQESMAESDYIGKAPAPDFPRGVEWLNTSHPWKMSDFRGKIVMLDFWTFCCINCIHVIPDLKRLEAKYGDELVVVGVHSAKFTTEQDTDNIRQAILRYEIEHPVINDHEFLLWRQYGVRAWPTIALIDPEGNVVGVQSGEGVYDTFDPILAEMVGVFDRRGTLDRREIDFETEMASAPSSLLSFPGKLAVDAPNDRLYISDSNHDRIVVSTLDGQVLHVIGSGQTGFADGDATSAQFNKPQGLAVGNGTLYVADTENHAIRAVDLDTWRVRTIAGTGRQARRYNEPGMGTDVALNSPWDVLLDGDLLYVAMAGSHQIWTLDVNTLRAQPYAGSAREDRTDGSLRASALAQPSGLTTDGEKLYVADSEVSAIRSIDLQGKGQGYVGTLAGGELFEFGLKNGSGLDARFQHPLGVAYHDGYVYVADTYNNAIRRIRLDDARASTFLGDGRAGFRDGRNPRFDEPNDVKVADGKLYIADTNNHRIRVADLDTREVTTFEFKNPDMLRPRMAEAPDDNAWTPSRVIQTDAHRVAPGQREIVVDVTFPRDHHLNADAPSAVSVRDLGGHVVGSNGEERLSSVPVRVPVTLSEGMGSVAVDLTLYYCEEDAKSLCFFDDVRLEIPLTVTSDASDDPVEVEYEVTARM